MHVEFNFAKCRKYIQIGHPKDEDGLVFDIDEDV